MATEQTLLLGNLALRQGYITEEQLNRALELQERSGSLLGDILVGQGYIRAFDLYRILADQLHLPHSAPQLPALVDKADFKLARRFEVQNLMTHLFFPLYTEDNKLFVLIHDSQNPQVEKKLAKEFPDYQLEKILATKRDIKYLIESCFKKQILRDSVIGLFYRSPAESAVRIFTSPQIIFFFFFTTLLIFSLLYFPQKTITGLIIFFNILFLSSVVFKFILSVKGAYHEMRVAGTAADMEKLPEIDLPVYSILIPVFREPDTIEQLIEALRQMDYPKEKMDVIFLFEEEDQNTLEAAKKANPPSHWQFIVVPPSQPQTKPKACNFGLAIARGKYITIYDAEDIPEPDQLKKAVAAFNNHPDNYVCFQAALNYYNASDNILTRLFTLEYSYWFDYLLNGLDALKMPIPLGGTSNHFRTDKLRELGGWDPFNVTEDADLGLRAFSHGYKVGTLNSTTYEEASNRIPVWIKQRSRWLKGYLQTFLLHNRRPVNFIKKTGLRGWLTLQLFIGGNVISSLVAPFFWFLFIYWLVTRGAGLNPHFYGPVLYISLFNLLFGNFLVIYLSTLAVFRRQYYHLTYFALLNPLYYILQSVAAWRALWQLFTRPFYWEKTIHGLAMNGVNNNNGKKLPINNSFPASS